MIYLKNILVTGGCGFVGTHLAKFYADQGHNVLVFDNLSRINIFGHYLKNSKYNWEKILATTIVKYPLTTKEKKE